MPSGRRYPTQEERDERVNAPDDPEAVLKALLDANVSIEDDQDADHAR